MSLLGVGTLAGDGNGVKCVLSGEGTVEVKIPNGAVLSGVGDTYAESTNRTGHIDVDIPFLGGLLSDFVFSAINVSLPPLTPELVEEYVPLASEPIYGVMPPISFSGFMSRSKGGDITATLPPLLSKSSDHDFGEINATLGAVAASFFEDPTPGDADFITGLYAADRAAGEANLFVFINNQGVIEGTVEATVRAFYNWLEEMEAEGVVVSYATLLADALEDLFATAASGSELPYTTTETTVTTSDTGVEGTVVTTETGYNGETIVTTVVTVETAPGVYTITTTVETTYLRPALDNNGRVWVVNVESGASSQYEGYGFNSFFERDGEYYGVAENGIFLLGETTDVGLDIDSYIDFGTNNCGLLGLKKVLNVYVGVSEGGKTYLRVTTDTGTSTYALARSQRGPTNWRAEIPHGVQGAYWNFELISSDSYELDMIEFVPAKLSRRM